METSLLKKSLRTSITSLVVVLLIGCRQDPSSTETVAVEEAIEVYETEVLVNTWHDEPRFDSLLKSHNMNGAILVKRLSDVSWFTNDSNYCSSRSLPASTFKIPNSLIAIDLGIAHPDRVQFMFENTNQRLDVWAQNHDLRSAFHTSCVPCYQEIARTIGPQRMEVYLDILNYGDMVVNHMNIDEFWLEGESGISQIEQVQFLELLYGRRFNIRQQSMNLLVDMMRIDSTDTYELYGKTGWSIREGHNTGWFVGWVKTDDETYVFATRIEPEEAFDMSLFPVIRSQITMEALRMLGFL